jgi:hypothetical protein
MITTFKDNKTQKTKETNNTGPTKTGVNQGPREG